MVEPIAGSGLSAGASAIRSAWSRRGKARETASNVVLLTEATPRQWDGYLITCEVFNGSAFGISDVSVHLEMVTGELELDGAVIGTAISFAPKAVAGGEMVSLTFPHVVRLAVDALDPAAVSADSGYRATVYWIDGGGNRWRRVGGGRAARCKKKDFPGA